MININSVSKSFLGKIAVNDLTLKISEGQIMGLLGANGAGKSTTINMILGFIKPDSGKVSVNEMDTSIHCSDVRKMIGYIPENVNLYSYLTGFENLDYFCIMSGLKYSKLELQNFLEICGLTRDNHSIKVEAYSKGMRQKVGIAIAYAKKAKVYLLDEPASGLDPLASNELSLLLKKIVSEGATILMASHDIFRVREICNRIGILKQGSLVKEIQSEQVTAPELESIYLEYMKN